MILRERVPFRISTGVLLMVAVLVMLTLPGWSQRPDKEKEESKAEPVAAEGDGFITQAAAEPEVDDVPTPVVPQSTAEPVAEEGLRIPATSEFEPGDIAPSSSGGSEAAGHEVKGRVSRDDKEVRLRKLEQQIESLLKQMQKLQPARRAKDIDAGLTPFVTRSRGKSRNWISPTPQRSKRDRKPSTSPDMALDPGPASRSIVIPQTYNAPSVPLGGRNAEVAETFTVTRARYKLPKAKIRVLVPFLKENLKHLPVLIIKTDFELKTTFELKIMVPTPDLSVPDLGPLEIGTPSSVYERNVAKTKSDVGILTITTMSTTQQVIGQFIGLMQVAMPKQKNVKKPKNRQRQHKQTFSTPNS